MGTWKSVGYKSKAKLEWGAGQMSGHERKIIKGERRQGRKAKEWRQWNKENRREESGGLALAFSHISVFHSVLDGSWWIDYNNRLSTWVVMRWGDTQCSRQSTVKWLYIGLFWCWPSMFSCNHFFMAAMCLRSQFFMIVMQLSCCTGSLSHLDFCSGIQVFCRHWTYLSKGHSLALSCLSSHVLVTVRYLFRNCSRNFTWFSSSLVWTSAYSTSDMSKVPSYSSNNLYRMITFSSSHLYSVLLLWPSYMTWLLVTWLSCHLSWARVFSSNLLKASTCSSWSVQIYLPSHFLRAPMYMSSRPCRFPVCLSTHLSGMPVYSCIHLLRLWTCLSTQVLRCQCGSSGVCL